MNNIYILLRPTWEKCSLYIEGGGERWQQLSEETSTSEKVDILLSEMTGHDMSVIKVGGTSVIEFFEPKVKRLTFLCVRISSW